MIIYLILCIVDIYGECVCGGVRRQKKLASSLLKGIASQEVSHIASSLGISMYVVQKIVSSRERERERECRQEEVKFKNRS